MLPSQENQITLETVRFSFVQAMLFILLDCYCKRYLYWLDLIKSLKFLEILFAS